MSTPMRHRRVITHADELEAARCANGRIVLIDDDPEILDALSALLNLQGYACAAYADANHYLSDLSHNQPEFPGPSCVLCDVKMPQLGGLEFQKKLRAITDTPIVIMSGQSGAAEAIDAFRAGAQDFLLKPFDANLLLTVVDKALAISRQMQQQHIHRAEIQQRIDTLTARETEVIRRVAAGLINPVIADELGIALRTVKLHRQRALEKLNVSTVADLVRISDAFKFR